MSGIRTGGGESGALYRQIPGTKRVAWASAHRRHPRRSCFQNDEESGRPSHRSVRSDSAPACKVIVRSFLRISRFPFTGTTDRARKCRRGVLATSFWMQGMMAGLPASYFCIKAFSETDLTEDLKKIDVPTLILHGDDDQIVPINDSAMLSSKIIKDAKLIVYKERATHGTCARRRRDRINTWISWQLHQV